jgi:hypothetical protein
MTDQSVIFKVDAVTRQRSRINPAAKARRQVEGIGLLREWQRDVARRQ